MKRLFNLMFVHDVIVVLAVVMLGFCGQPCSCDYTKECTNIPQLTSHTERIQLENSRNKTLKQEAYSHYHHHHRHLTPNDDSAWSSLIPRKVLKEKEDEYFWSIMYRQLKNQAGSFSVPGSLLTAVSLHDVRLDTESFNGRAQQTNLEYLLMLDPDRLVWSFRKTAGLLTPGSPYGGWESPNQELRGHFVGHYMSASAQMWASTHNAKLKEKMSAVVSSLSDCQDKIGTGYLSAFPSEFFDRLEAIEPVWAPYYTIHKLLAGLLDQYEFAGNDQALKMAIRMVEYFYHRVQNVILKYSITRHWKSLNEEFGGMNDVLYRLYSITGNQKHLLLAHLFDKPCFLGLLAVQTDDLANFHTNTHIPIVIGSQRRYEVTGDPLYMAIGTFFMDIVNTSHSYATGGTSVSEFWSDPKRLANTLQTENQESCTTYNMLKVSRNLFRWTKDVAYADYYERALTNGVLGIQRGQDPGVMIYMLPLGRGVSKATSYHRWGSQFNSFWCCYGTGIESFSKLGDSIYFQEEGSSPGLYIIQYISSSLDWKSGKMAINQKVEHVSSLDPYLRVSLTFSPYESAGKTSILNLRIPSWTSHDAKATLDGENLSVPAPGNFLEISREWSSGNKLTLELPMVLRTEAIKDDRPEYASVQAILFGPYLLAGHSSGDWDIKTGSTASSLSDWITSVPASYSSQLISLTQKVDESKFVLTNTVSSITMEDIPETGTDSAVNSTFRVVPKDPTAAIVSSFEDLIGKSVVLEPFGTPGMLLTHRGSGKNLVIEKPDGGKASSAFRLVKGLDGKNETVSLESENMKGCFVYSAVEYSSGTSITLNCGGDSSDDGFKKAASFGMNKGFSEYHPISFIAKGMKRDFLLAPIMSMRDESYTVYFNIEA